MWDLNHLIHILNLYSSIPFFFEPNFDANIKPLAAVLRPRNGDTAVKEFDARRSVNYGDFLVAKVGNNFATEKKGRY